MAEDGKEKGKIPNKRAIRLQWKRFAVFSLCYFLAYTAFRGLRDLQSTINSAEGLGLATLTVLKTCSAVAGLLLPAIIRLKLGTKWSIVIGTALFTVYTASNYYPSAYLLLTVAVLPGIGDALMWISRGVYISTVATDLAAAHGRNAAVDIALMTGIFISVSRMSTMFGNLISSLVFKAGYSFREERRTRESVDLGSCGIRACGSVGVDSVENSTGALVPPDQSSRNVLISIYLGVGALAVVIALVFLERVPPKSPPGRDREGAKTQGVLHGMTSAFRLMKHPRMMLLIPALCFLGADVAFTSEHFTKFFVGCTQGIESIGFVMMSFYLTGIFWSIALGRLIKYTGRAAVYILGATVYLLVLTVMLLWDPETGELWHLFLMACGLGIPRAALTTVTSTVLVVIFPDQKEAAFGNLCFWQSMTFAAVSALGVPQSVCAVHLVCTIMAMLVVVLVMYIILEVQIKKDQASHERMKHVANEGESERLKEDAVEIDTPL